MKRRTTLIALISFALGLTVGTGSLVLAAGQYGATSGGVSLVPPSPPTLKSESEPQTVSGKDIGLRLIGKHNGRVVATLMTKTNNGWVEVELQSQNVLATGH